MMPLERPFWGVHAALWVGVALGVIPARAVRLRPGNRVGDVR
jgi:hypothetical protein